MFFESARFLGLARAMTVSMIYPLMSAGFAAAFLVEPLNVRVGTGSVVTLSGIALIVQARSGEGRHQAPLSVGNAAALTAAETRATSLLVPNPALGSLHPRTAHASPPPRASLQP